MASQVWNHEQHVINASHVRAYARGSRNADSAPLRLHVQRWIPKANQVPKFGDPTLVFAHGVGNSKESYEPFFDCLLECIPNIRSIVAMDVAHHGKSFLLNKDVIGDEPNWYDSGRDLVHAINVLQGDLPPPLIGIGHSWGGVTLIAASSLHPRLFSGLILIEPTLGTGYSPNHRHRSVWMARRRDWWPSRQAAKEDFLKIAFYRRFQPRVLELILEHELRDVTSDDLRQGGYEHFDPSAGLGVTLTTPKSMHVYTMMRTDLEIPGQVSMDLEDAALDVKVVPGFFRPEKIPLVDSLPGIYPPVVYVWGEKSDIANKPPAGPAYRKFLLDTTGSAGFGSGGHAKGKTTELMIPEATHTIPFEIPMALARDLTPWIRQTESEHVQASTSADDTQWHISRLNPDWVRRLNKL